MGGFFSQLLTISSVLGASGEDKECVKRGRPTWNAIAEGPVVLASPLSSTNPKGGRHI
jgi:hypothetical protein